MAVQTKVLRQLQQDNNLVILPAYKGKATVVMDRSDYDEKMTIYPAFR